MTGLRFRYMPIWTFDSGEWYCTGWEWVLHDGENAVPYEHPSEEEMKKRLAETKPVEIPQE